MPNLTSWTAAWAAVVPLADAEAVAVAGADLLMRYAEPHRHYHTAIHVAEMVDALGGLVDDPIERVLGVLVAWFHDAVYDPSRGDNEAASADVARSVGAGLGLDPGAVERVAELVLGTADHALPEGDRLAAGVHDADLWILAAPADRFDEYCRQVRAEYADIPDPAYAAGRAAILAPFAARPRLFATPVADRAWTAAARANLARELARLG